MRAPLHPPVNTRQIERKTAQHNKKQKVRAKFFGRRSDMNDDNDDDDYHWLEVH